MLPTIAREDDVVVMIDQRKLPAQEVYVRCKTAAEVARAIKTMVIRGAPAIGVAAAMGIALGMRRSRATGTQKFAAEFQKICEMMAATRPTAVNLFWAIDRMRRSFAAGAQAGESVDQIKDRLDAEASAIHDEDVASCRAMGAFGAEVLPADARVLTHWHQRRHREQDWHVRCGRPRARAQHPVLRGRAAVDDRSEYARRRTHPDRRAQRQRGDAHRWCPDGRYRIARLESRLRCDAAQV